MNRCDDNNQAAPIRRDVPASRSFCKNRRQVFYDQIVHFYVNLYFLCIFIYTFAYSIDLKVVPSVIEEFSNVW